MRANYRKLLIGLVIIAVLGAFAYHSRHKIHLADFTWKKFMHSVSLANIPLLLLARKSHTPVSGMFGIWVLERAFDFAAALMLFSISLLIFPRGLFDDGASGEWVDKARTGGWLLVALLATLTGSLIYFRLHGAVKLHERLEGWRASRGWRKA